MTWYQMALSVGSLLSLMRRPRVTCHGVLHQLPPTGPTAWKAAEYKSNPHTFTYTFTNDDLTEIDNAVRASRKDGIPIQSLTPSTFQLPRLNAKLHSIGAEVVHGRGFQLFKGLPVSEWLKPVDSNPTNEALQREVAEHIMRAYMGLGVHFGSPRSQNKKGEMINHVRDCNLDPNDPSVRLYATRAAQPFHTDSCDLVGLLCLRTAYKGGLSSWCSSHALYNTLLETQPDLARVLAEPFAVDRKGEIPPGKQAWYRMPVFNYALNGQLSVIYARGFIEVAQRHADAPRLTPLQIEALDAVDRLAASDELRLDYSLEPGDIQLLHNHHTLHARSEFTDYPGLDHRKRHLLRLWLCPQDGIQLPEVFAERYGTNTVGDRGGIVVEGAKLNVPLLPCQ